MERTDRSAWIDALMATLLAGVLAAAWSVRAWSNLASLRLPDPDDMMRLQQIRDWLGGQAFADLTQYRLGADGVAMHWSRLPDLVPGAIIWSLEGPIGRHAAEIVAAIVWPAMLVAGVATSLSVVVGMETTPLRALIGLVIVIDWVVGGRPARDRLMGFGIALCAVTLASSIVFHTTAWDYAASAGFTAISARALMVASFVPIGLALAGWDSSPRVRLSLGIASALALGATLTISTPQCFAPYGNVPPLLRSLWLMRVGEAQPLFAAPLVVAIGYAGLTVAGIAAGIWQWRRERSRGWLVLLALQLGAMAVP